MYMYHNTAVLYMYYNTAVLSAYQSQVVVLHGVVDSLPSLLLSGRQVHSSLIHFACFEMVEQVCFTLLHG